jgi:arylsulfatase
MINGTPNEFTTFNGVPVPVKAQYLWYPFWGSDKTFPHFAAPWAWAMSTPFKWVKQVASHFGGTAQGMAISWPGHINDVGGIRRQFHHVIDVVPTILEATGIPQPDMIDGIKQIPIEGVSMKYTWDKANANAATQHATQYFEMLGNRAIYQDGWVAATTPATLPWELSNAPPPDVITGYKWELYNVDQDPTQAEDLAAKMPDKLKQLQDVFYSEAAKYNVLPLDNSSLARWNTPRPSLTAGQAVFTYSGELSGVPTSAAPSILNKSYTITAEVEIPKGGAEGMIVTEGGRFGGYGLFLSQGVAGIRSGKPVFIYNLLNLKRTIWSGPELGAGKHTVVFDFKSDGPGLAKGGTGVLSVDGKEVDRKSMKQTTPVTFPEDETFDVGLDTRTGVAMLEYRYDPPFKFTGKINKLTFKLEPEVKDPAQAKAELGPSPAPEPDPIEAPKRQQLPAPGGSPAKTK